MTTLTFEQNRALINLKQLLLYLKAHSVSREVVDATLEEVFFEGAAK